MLNAVAFSIKIQTQKNSDFATYCATYGKSYLSEAEYTSRLGIYNGSAAAIQQLNASEKTSVHGFNFISDFTDQE